jgi:hypothetical protein
MVEHVVLFKIRPDATDAQKNEMLANLLGLKAKIRGIVHATAGANYSDRSRGYTHGFVVRFADRAALDAYLPHPEHQAVVERCVKPITDEVLVVDYEFN